MKQNPAHVRQNIRITGPWSLELDGGSGDEPMRGLRIAPAERRVVERERHDALPLFNAGLSGWRRGVPLLGCQSQKTTVKNAHGSRHFVEAPPEDALHHYASVVLGAKPDLVVSEFVNDALYRELAAMEAAYGKFRDDFRAIGAEWIVLTPHYLRPDWMNLTGEKGVDQDPRPYMLALREFCARNDIPLADASLRWGRLWRQGIPYTTLLLNAINHPDERGMALFADSLMRFFPGDADEPQAPPRRSRSRSDG